MLLVSQHVVLYTIKHFYLHGIYQFEANLSDWDKAICWSVVFTCSLRFSNDFFESAKQLQMYDGKFMSLKTKKLL